MTKGRMPNPIIVVHDPGDAPFNEGAELTTDDVICMIKFKSFYPGTILKLQDEIKRENFTRLGFSSPGLYEVRPNSVRRVKGTA